MVWVLSKVDFTSSSKLYILSDTLFNHVLICTDHAKRRIGSISDLVCSAFVQKWSVQALSEKHLVLKGTSRVVVWTSGLQISPGRPNRIMVKAVPFFHPEPSIVSHVRCCTWNAAFWDPIPQTGISPATLSWSSRRFCSRVDLLRCSFRVVPEAGRFQYDFEIL